MKKRFWVVIYTVVGCIHTYVAHDMYVHENYLLCAVFAILAIAAFGSACGVSR